jgi:hypothetical protein
MKTLTKIILGMSICASSQGIHAAITGGTNFVNLTGNEPISTPGVYENNLQAFGWDELTGITLGSLVSVVDYNLGITANTLINSHLIGSDPNIHTSITSTITFDSHILGVIWTTYGLNATDAALGLPTVTYYTPDNLGLELIDTFSVSGNSMSFFNSHANRPGDFMRVITSAVPEPSIYAMFGLGLAGVMLVARRQDRSASKQK